MLNAPAPPSLHRESTIPELVAAWNQGNETEVAKAIARSSASTIALVTSEIVAQHGRFAGRRLARQIAEEFVADMTEALEFAKLQVMIAAH